PRPRPVGNTTATSRHARAARIRPEGAAGSHDVSARCGANEAHRYSVSGFEAFGAHANDRANALTVLSGVTLAERRRGRPRGAPSARAARPRHRSAAAARAA